jgi:hypothetical protein
MNKFSAILFGLLFCLSGCTVYTEKQSEAVSQNVYAVNDSISKARIDLAEFYSNETTKFIVPPKHPIKIDSIYEPSNQQSADKKRIVVVPDKYKNDKVIVVGSNDYNQLLKDSAIKKQLQQESLQKDAQIKLNTAELTKQKDMRDKMVKDLNALQKENLQLKLALLKSGIAIAVLLGLMLVYIYFKLFVL